MKTLLFEIKKYTGHYSGIGINHEKEKFIGKFELVDLLNGKGFQLKFIASDTTLGTILFLRYARRRVRLSIWSSLAKRS